MFFNCLTERGSKKEIQCLCDTFVPEKGIGIAAPRLPPGCLAGGITPHIGSASRVTREQMSVISVENMLAGLKGKPLPFIVK